MLFLKKSLTGNPLFPYSFLALNTWEKRVAVAPIIAVTTPIIATRIELSIPPCFSVGTGVTGIATTIGVATGDCPEIWFKGGRVPNALVVWPARI